MGIGGGVDSVKDVMMPKDEGGLSGPIRTVISIAILLALAYGAVKLYGMAKA